MMFELWSRGRLWRKPMSSDELWQSLPPETREAIDAEVSAALAERKYYIRTAIRARTEPYWRPRFFWNRKQSRLRRRAEARLQRAAEWRAHPKRGGAKLPRSKGWGARACPHWFGRDCLGSWKTWVGGKRNRIVTSLARRAAQKRLGADAP